MKHETAPTRTARSVWILPLLVLSAVLLGMTPWLLHRASATRPLELVVLDKTVPFENRLEHRSLFWLLEHLKIVHRDGRPYDAARDYLGTFPGDEPGDRPVRTTDLTVDDVRDIDLLYLADTYGVYEEDLASEDDMRAALERSRKVYGGTTSAEVDAVVAALDAGTTVVAEFNTLASPTAAVPRERQEELLGIRWTHWIGRYFQELDDEQEVPRWLRRTWEREWQQDWEFTGAGYVLFRDDKECEVLRVGFEARSAALVIDREQPVDPLLRRASDGVPYTYWFDVVEPTAGSEVLARYRWQLTPAGQERLRARGLEPTFPAVVRHRHPRAASYYFAGDFADNAEPAERVDLAGYLPAQRWSAALGSTPPDQAFFWRFYAPVMQELLESLER